MARIFGKGAPTEDGFSFPDGIYVEQNQLEIDEKQVTQTACQKSKMVRKNTACYFKNPSGTRFPCQKSWM